MSSRSLINKGRRRCFSAARFFFCLVFSLLLVPSCTTTAPRYPLNPEGRQLLQDPGITYGKLPNGFQYILMPNRLPENRVEIRLNVFAGSMNETDDEQGLAHFLEHMMFNGSTHFEPDRLIEYFQNIGMDFGGDANAHTSWFNTVYDLSIPDSKPANVDDALLVIEDWAQGALLLESEVDKERGIILAEKRERDSVSYRTFKKSLAFELPESRYVKRLPIGQEKVLKNTGQRELRGFYDRWYRPENMLLILVGDFDLPVVKSLVDKRFSKMRPRVAADNTSGLSSPGSFFDKPATNGVQSDMTGQDMVWRPHRGIKSFYHHEPEAGSTEVTIETVKWVPFTYETVEDLKFEVLESMATRIVQNRLSKMVSLAQADFSEATAFCGSFWQHLKVSSIGATCNADQWEDALNQIEKTLRQALIHGFTEQELARVKAEIRLDIETRVKQASTRKSAGLAKNILQAAQQKELLLSPAQTKAILLPLIQDVGLDRLHQVFKQVWSQDHRLVLVTGDAVIESAPEAHILNTYRKSAADEVTAFRGYASKPFPYIEKPSVFAEIKNRADNVSGLGITDVCFKNGTRLIIKKTNYKKNNFLFKVNFGPGRKAQPLRRPGLASLTEAVLNESGFGGISREQYEEAIAGKSLDYNFNVSESTFSINGSGDPEDLELIFQVVSHFFQDPGFRSEALELSKTRYRQEFESFIRTAQGVMQIKADRFLAGNDMRFGLAAPDIVDQYTIEDIRRWILPFIQSSPVEICVAGDIDPQVLISLASQYVDCLGARKLLRNHETPEKYQYPDIHFPTGGQTRLTVDSRIEKGIVDLSFLTDDFWDIRQTRRLSILSRILSERLRVSIRENLGETYSPYAYNDASSAYDGYGVFHIVVQAEPKQLEFVYGKIRDIIASVLEDGISDSEVKMALGPVLNHIKVFRKSNLYWLNSVMSRVSEHPEKFDWAVSLESDYASISAQDMNLLAEKYLRFENSAVIFITSNKE